MSAALSQPSGSSDTMAHHPTLTSAEHLIESDVLDGQQSDMSADRLATALVTKVLGDHDIDGAGVTRVTERASWSFLGGFGEGLSLRGAIDGAGYPALPAYVDALRHIHTHTDYPSALPKNSSSDHSGHVHLFGLHEPVFAVLFLITPHHNIDFTPSAIKLLKHAVELCLSKRQGGYQQHNHHQPAAPVGGSFFSERQIQVLGLLAEGLCNTEIGRKLSISASLAKQEVVFLMHSLGARSRLDAVVQAQKNGLLPV